MITLPGVKSTQYILTEDKINLGYLFNTLGIILRESRTKLYLPPPPVNWFVRGSYIFYHIINYLFKIY